MAGVQSKHCDDSFVGREEEIQGVIQEWRNGKQLFPVYGIDSIGKTCFANKLFMRLQSQGYQTMSGQIPDYEFDLNGIADLQEMIEIVTEELEINRQRQYINERNWIQHIKSFLKKQVNKEQNKNLVLFFRHYGSIDDKIELKNAFAKLCEELVGSPRIRIFFTSNIKIRFAKKQMCCHSSLLGLLNAKESKEMLRNLLKDKHVDLGIHEERIIELCEGLPLALMIVANGLAEEDNMLESELMKQLLEISRLSTLSPDYYAEHEKMRNVIGDPIKKLKDVFQKSMASLANLRGSFDKESGAQVVGARNKAEFMHKDMITLTRSCFYKFNSKTQMFDYPDMQREFVSNDILRNQDCPDTKENLRQLYNGRLHGLEKELESNSTLTVSEQDSRSLRDLVDTALVFSRSGGYPDFIQTMAEANLFETKHFNNGSFDVLEVMISQCQCPQLKTFFEKGIPLSILAKMIIQQKTGKVFDLDWCHKEEAEESKNGPSRRLADLFQQLGWRYLLGGDRNKALKYHKQSHEVLTSLQQTEDLLFASCLNGLGFMYAVCGNWPEAMWHFFRSVQLRVQFLGDEDLALDIQCYNITLLCHMRQDCHKNHTISEFRLEEKKDASTPNLTVARCTVELGMQFLRIKQADRAYEVVKYGLDISSKKGSSEINIRLQADLCNIAIETLRSHKDVNQKESWLKGMLKHLCKETPAWKTTLTELGLVLLDLEKFKEAEKAAHEVIVSKCSPIDSLSRSVFEICRRLVVVYTNLNDREKTAQWYSCAIEEINRLGDDEECRKSLREIEHLVIDTAKEKGPNVPLPRPSNDQGSASLRTWYSPESKKAAKKENHVGLTSHKNASSGIPRSSKSSASDLAAGQDHSAGDSKGFSSPCTAPRSLQNQIPLGGERISQPHRRTGAGFSPPGDFSPVNNYHSAHGGDGDFCARPSMSHGHVQDVHLSNHNNSPHSPDTRADRDFSPLQENDEERNGMASGTSVPSDNRSDSPGYQSILTPNQRPLYDWNREGSRSDVAPTTSPVESSWPTASLSRTNTADNPATHCLVTGTSGQGWGIPHEQRVPDEANSAIGQGEVGSNLTDSGCAQADSSISLAPCLVSDVGQEQSSLTSVTCVPPQRFVTGGQTHVKEIDEQTIGLPAVPRQQNMVLSLGVGSVQKINENENEHLYHDHVRPTSRGHPEAQSSRMDERPREQISGRQSDNLNLNFQHTNSETFPKELISGVSNSGNAVGRVTPVITGDNRRRVSEPTRPGDGLLPLNPGIPRRDTEMCHGSYAEITRSPQNHVKYPNQTQNITNIRSVVENPQGPSMTGTSDFSRFQQELYEQQFGVLPPEVLRKQTQFTSGSVSSPHPLSLSERDTLIMQFDPDNRRKMCPNTFGYPYQGREQPLELGSILTPFPLAYASDSASNLHASVSQEYSHSLQKHPDHTIPQPQPGYQGISFDQNQNNHAMQQSLQSRPRLHYPPNTPWQPPSQNPNGVDPPGGCPTAHKAPFLSQLGGMVANTLGWVRQWGSNTHSQNDSIVIDL